MKLQRWEPTTRYIGTGEYMGDMERDDEGDWYDAADVDALLARIRAAVAEERRAVRSVMGRPHPKGYITISADALDALLSPGECSSLCAPGSGERCMVTDDGRCPNGGA